LELSSNGLDSGKTVSRIFSILFLLMSLAIAMREIPELYNLADDPSNDGQVFSWQDQTQASATDRANKTERVPLGRAVAFVHPEHLTCTSVVLGSTGQDILRLTSSLRT
jgi:hypothetical protein